MNEQKYETNIDDLKRLIQEETDKAFTTTGAGLFLSQLGTLLSRNKPQLRELLKNTKLVDFIEKKMVGTIKIIDSPEDSKIKIALPANAQINDDVTQFIPKRNAVNSLSHTPRYNPALWAAFLQPLEKGCTRLIGFEPILHFEDIKDSSLEVVTKKVVSEDLIIDQDKEPIHAKRSRCIAINIDKWLNDNNIPLELVKAQSTETIDSESKKESLFEAMIAVFNEEELRRILIPLDLVAKLHRQK